jgi:6-phosphogluconolactonase
MTRFIRWARATDLAVILLAVTIAAAQPAAAGRDGDASGHVYVQTIAVGANAVVAFERHADGRLTPNETVATGGIGTSAGLEDQAAIAITGDERHLFAVNAGSDGVSLFDIDEAGLELTDVQPVGDRPVSVAGHGNLVYVLNQGADTIQAPRITDEDTLADIPHSTRPLSTTNANAARSRSVPTVGCSRHREGHADHRHLRGAAQRTGRRSQRPAVLGSYPVGFQLGPDGRLYFSEWASPLSVEASPMRSDDARDEKEVRSRVPRGRGQDRPGDR